jgi:outer membrane immunogenic protein
MYRTLIAGTFAFVAGGQALAADLPAAPPPVRAPAAFVPPPAAYNWSGFYVGVNAGAAWLNQDGVTNSVATTLDPSGLAAGTLIGTGPSTSSTGFAGGGQIGFNYQVNQFVFGAEADIDYLSNKATVNGTEASGAVVYGTNTHQYTMPMFSTVRGRLGFAADNVLLYGTGGLAMGEYDVQRTQVTGFAGTATAGTVENSDNLRLGWTAGAGIEYAFSENWTARVEYLYANLESVTYTFPIANRTAAAPTESVNLVRAGLNFKFGGF